MRELKDLLLEYDRYQKMGLSLNMARGKPNKEQLDLSNGLFSVLKEDSNFVSDGVDVRNYGNLTGINASKALFSSILGIDRENIIIHGNSSLNAMYDQISRSMTHGVNGSTPWMKLDKPVKWLCPVPGYDRHFAITEYFGIEMINIPMNEDGPDMDLVEQYVKDESVKGIWCVPIYSNPTGITYSDEVVKRFARLKPKAKDFRIYWDEAYLVHHLYNGHNDTLLNLFDECKKYGNEDLPYIFFSTSKIGFAGSGVSIIAASNNNIEFIKNQLKYQTISFDKINQLRQALFFIDKEHVDEHMKKHADILRPKFEIVENVLKEELTGIASWSKPNGGYFVSLYVNGIAKEVYERCKNCGVTLTDIGCAYPYHDDPYNSHIRIAPTYLSNDELELAMKVLCLSIQIEMSLKQ